MTDPASVADAVGCDDAAVTVGDGAVADGDGDGASGTGGDAEQLLRSATALVAAELARVDGVIERRLDSDIALIRALGAHIIGGGGKRLRPLILLLAARAGGHDDDGDDITLAAVIEFIHTATLLHDDVVDASKLRRGRATANQVWGNEASVLVGDFLYSRAFEMMVEVGNLEAMKILAATTNAIAEGEVMQLLCARAPDTSEADYWRTIHRKTAKLFESSARLGAVLAKRGDDECAAFAEYGIRLGAAFQLVDDILDYSADARDTGKHAGDDIREGKPTLPLIYALRVGGDAERRAVRRAIENFDAANLPEIFAIVESTGALAYTRRQAQAQAAAATDALHGVEASKYKDALAGIAEFAVRRGR